MWMHPHPRLQDKKFPPLICCEDGLVSQKQKEQKEQKEREQKQREQKEREQKKRGQKEREQKQREQKPVQPKSGKPTAAEPLANPVGSSPRITRTTLAMLEQVPSVVGGGTQHVASVT